MNCRFNKKNLIKRIEFIASRKEFISLTRFDACEFIENVINNNPKNCLTFLDPPYYKKGKQLYFNAYDNKDHLKLAKVVQHKLKEPWIVTYGDVPEINVMYSSCQNIRYEVNYSVSTKERGSEIMYYSSSLEISPETVD